MQDLTLAKLWESTTLVQPLLQYLLWEHSTAFQLIVMHHSLLLCCPLQWQETLWLLEPQYQQTHWQYSLQLCPLRPIHT